MSQDLDIMGRDWALHPLNLAHREGVKRAVAEEAKRKKIRSVPSPEQRRAKQLQNALASVEMAHAIRADASTVEIIALLKQALPATKEEAHVHASSTL